MFVLLPLHFLNSMELDAFRLLLIWQFVQHSDVAAGTAAGAWALALHARERSVVLQQTPL